jgi:DNA-binding response OmpR family regulator
VGRDAPAIALVQQVARLQMLGVTVAATSPEALGEAHRRAPDLVLVDADLPGDHGFRLARELRELPNGGGMPIAFLSSDTSFDRRVEAPARGWTCAPPTTRGTSSRSSTTCGRTSCSSTCSCRASRASTCAA